jgi:hypothetical protein
MDLLERPPERRAQVQSRRAVTDWRSFHPRVAGAVLLLLGVVAARAVCNFYFGTGSIDSAPSSAVLYASSPGLFALGIWLAATGVPKALPFWWLGGTAAVITLSVALSCALGLAIEGTPKVRVLRFEQSGYDFVRPRPD